MENIKQLLITKMMLQQSPSSSTESDTYFVIYSFVIMGILNYFFEVLPELLVFLNKLFRSEVKRKVRNESNSDFTNIKFSRDYESGSLDCYSVTDSLIEFITNVDCVKKLTYDKFYMINTHKDLEIAKDIKFKLLNVMFTKDNLSSISFEIFSEVLSLTELKQWVSDVHKQTEYTKRNKFGNTIHFFDEIPCRTPKQLLFSITPFKTNKTLNTLYGKSINVIRERIELFYDEKWYKQNGIPHTLGILLHGEPGVGKSSIIKAIANETNRHIFNIKLNEKTTQSQLWNLFYNESVSCMSSDVQSVCYIPNEKRLYVLEDVDCLTSVLLDRDLYPVKSTTSVAPKSDEDETVKMAKRMSEQFNGSTQQDEKVTLSFFLNLIDGILETPGRILVITTNYPDKIDKAVLRPGRIDINLKLGKCDTDCLHEMFSKFYSKQQSYNVSYDFTKYDNMFSPATVQKILSDNFNYPESAYKDLEKEKERISETFITDIGCLFTQTEEIKELELKEPEVKQNTELKEREIMSIEEWKEFETKAYERNTYGGTSDYLEYINSPGIPVSSQDVYKSYSHYDMKS